MTIVITDSNNKLELTQAEYDRLMFEYQQAFRMYYGMPPSFETWVREKRKATNTINSDTLSKYESAK